MFLIIQGRVASFGNPTYMNCRLFDCGDNIKDELAEIKATQNCLWLKDSTTNDRMNLPEIKKRMEQVNAMRLASPKIPTQKTPACTILEYFIPLFIS